MRKANRRIMYSKFDRIIKAVGEVTDLLPCQICSRRKFPETIEAKWIAVYLLKENGYSSGRVAELMEMTQRNVNMIVSSMNADLPQMCKLGSKLEAARKYLLRMEM